MIGGVKRGWGWRGVHVSKGGIPRRGRRKERGADTPFHTMLRLIGEKEP